MKLNERMRYPHPVLSEYSSDYISGEFRAEFSQNLTKDDELRIESNLTLDSSDLRDLIDAQEAAIGYFIVCRPTYFNRLQQVPAGKSEKFFDANKLFGTVQIRPVVWTIKEVKDYESDLIDSEFGTSTPIAKGSVIAMGSEFRFSMDRKKYKPFDSIFALARGDKVPSGTFEVDPAGEDGRITIAAEKETFNSIAGMRNTSAGRSMLLGAVYMPAVMDVISKMQLGDSMQGYKWYRVFSAKCDDLAVDPSDNAQSPLKLAQRLLGQPLTKTIKVAES